MTKKVGILTHPLINNYGGILQAFALKEAIKELGPDVLVIDRRQNDYKIKKFLRIILGRLRGKDITSKAQESNYPQYSFIQNYIQRSRRVDNTVLLKRLIKNDKIDCIAFGSDQVWRADFNRLFDYNFWGCFLSELKNVKGFSYAASIADKNWLYNEEETRIIKRGLNNLQAVSVREYEGQDICKENLGINPTVIIDPTLLHDSSFYDAFESKRRRKPYIFVYWLGDLDEIEPKLKELKNKYTIVTVSLRNKDTFVSVEDWLNLIKNAEWIFTDSFHGMVFSIIYHKQFTISKNASGGIGRLNTLFNLLGCPEKLEKPEANIDYEIVDSQLNLLRSEARKFLKEAVS